MSFLDINSFHSQERFISYHTLFPFRITGGGSVTTGTGTGTGTTGTGTLGDWAQCSSNSQCRNGCCSGVYSGGVNKCTPLSGGFNPNICMAGTGTPPAPTPTPPTTGSLGDWAQCSRNSQCRNGCCSGMYSGGVLKCTPLSGGVFNPSICTAV